MKVIPLLFALLTTPTWCEKNYSMTYALAELNSTVGMHDVLARMEALANTYCTDQLLASSYQGMRLCRQGALMELANKVDDAPFRDFVRRSQNHRLIHKRPILM